MDDIHIQAFLDVVDHGSFAGAARASGIARGTLRSRVRSLEEALGTQLLHRTIQGTVLTEAASVSLPHLREMAAARAALARDLRRLAGEEEEPIRVVSAPGFPPRAVSAIMGMLWSTHEALRVQLLTLPDPLADAPLDTDLVLHLGEPPTGPGWFSRVILRLEVGAFASEAWLAREGTPTTVEELLRHRLFVWLAPGGGGAVLPLSDGRALALEPAMATPEIHLLRWLASLDLGVVVAPAAGVGEPHGAGPLVRVLPDEVRGSVVVRASTPSRATERMNALLAQLSGRLGR